MISVEEFGKNKRAAFAALHSLNKGALNSKAVEAVLLAAEKTIDAVVEKHDRRGDAWVDSFSILTCTNLAGAKLDRVDLLLGGMSSGRISYSDCKDEIDEEIIDAIAYSAFGLWHFGEIEKL